jgi:hypothetical protein
LILPPIVSLKKYLILSPIPNAIARYDGITEGVIQDSSVLIDDTSNLSNIKSVILISSRANPGSSRILWYNAGSGIMNIGAAKIVNVTMVQTFTNKTLTAPNISFISNTGTITLLSDTTTLVGQNTPDTLINKTIIGSTNLVDASALQTTGASVNVSLATPPTTGSILTATSASTATWQAPETQIMTPGTTVLNRLVLWGDTTGDTLTQASLKFDNSIFMDTDDMNLIVVNSNKAIGSTVLANVTSGFTNVAGGV